jgi:uncharacterized membrane protein required for colicin V production
MIAASVQDLATDKLPINWFDVLLLALLVAGVFRGRKLGMSREVLPLFKWLTVVLVCGFCYPAVAPLFANALGAGKTASSIYGYLLLALLIIGVFMFFKRLLAFRTGENNFFGGSEYYLGMMSGPVRFFCMLLAVLALLHAPYYTQADIKAREAYVKRWYGGGLYSGNYFPDIYTLQQQVFKQSYMGPYLDEYLAPILIETTPPSADKPQQKPPAVKIQK